MYDTPKEILFVFFNPYFRTQQRFSLNFIKPLICFHILAVSLSPFSHSLQFTCCQRGHKKWMWITIIYFWEELSESWYSRNDHLFQLVFLLPVHLSLYFIFLLSSCYSLTFYCCYYCVVVRRLLYSGQKSHISLTKNFYNHVIFIVIHLSVAHIDFFRHNVTLLFLNSEIIRQFNLLWNEHFTQVTILKYFYWPSIHPVRKREVNKNCAKKNNSA